MSVYAISDLHMSSAVNKPMDIFKGWDNHINRIVQSWLQTVCDDDIVLLGGDLSWAIDLQNAMPDINFLADLPGHKVLIRGNHDYWWKSITTLRQSLPSKMYALQNDSVMIGNYLICGTRGWTVPERHQGAHDKKIYNREVERLKLSLQNMQSKRQVGQFVIAMAHYPPFNSLIKATPFTDLYNQYGVSKVIYGHLHGKAITTPAIVTINNTQFYLTSCDTVGHKVVLVD
ncbi:MAG: metallophosphoesterase [Clostridiales bacterium]|jgi:predicted phosphohydrolase|nr:metallophosphoesterase [Clostridiales bacterium]